MGTNGTAGAQAIKAVGGLCIAQDPDGAVSAHAAHLIDAGYADYILGPPTCPRCCWYASTRTRAATTAAHAAEEALPARRTHFREILAILRTRTRHDFTGYKKPTLLRRIQRRMGLTGTATLREYADLCAAEPDEVTRSRRRPADPRHRLLPRPRGVGGAAHRVIAPLVAARARKASHCVPG